MDFPSFFATCIHISVIARICEMLPGIPSRLDAESTESESIITTFASDDSIVAIMLSKSDSDKISIFSPPIPSRRARPEICKTDSSPETYKTGVPFAEYHELICSDSVDFPIPGSPESSTSEPATSPPPSTASSSADDEKYLDTSVVAFCMSFSVSRAFQVWIFHFFTTIFSFSASVFHSPQLGHFPIHFGVVALQLLQIYIQF